MPQFIILADIFQGYAVAMFRVITFSPPHTCVCVHVCLWRLLYRSYITQHVRDEIMTGWTKQRDANQQETTMWLVKRGNKNVPEFRWTSKEVMQNVLATRWSWQEVSATPCLGQEVMKDFTFYFFHFFLSFCLCKQEMEFCDCSMKLVHWWVSGGKSWSQASLKWYLPSWLNGHQNNKTSPLN